MNSTKKKDLHLLQHWPDLQHRILEDADHNLHNMQQVVILKGAFFRSRYGL